MPDVDRQGDEGEEEIPGDGINIKRFKVGVMRNAASYPAWMARINFGSKILPLALCLIGDAQPELIKIFLLQMGVNLFQMYKPFYRNVCGDVETAWKHFQQNRQTRMDLDPKVPYLGEDAQGVLIESSGEDMRDFYQRVGNPKHKDDLGEDGFVNAYHGALYKKLIVYILECGYSFRDLQEIYGGEQFDQLSRRDTPEEESMKTMRARDALEMQSNFMRRVIAGAYGVNGVYFFRNVDYLNTITLNPVDIICAVKPHGRRIAVLHLILQNGQQLPRNLHLRLFGAIEDYNRIKRREHQRPKWGIHMTDAHVFAIADTPVPADVQEETSAKAKTPAVMKATAKPTSTSNARSVSSTSSVYPSDNSPMSKQRPTPPPAKAGRGQGRGRQNASHRGGDWNQQEEQYYTGPRYHRGNW